MAVRVRAQLGDGATGGRAASATVRRAAQAALRALGIDEAEISLTLLGDDAIARLNHAYRDHDGPTDVLSFRLWVAGESPVGDIYIGTGQARRQADALSVPVDEELARLAIHGTLHVLGYDHPEAAREASEMWKLQESILARVKRS